MRFPITVLALALSVTAAEADSYKTGLYRITDQITVGESGHVLVKGTAVAGVRPGGSVTAVLMVDGRQCASSTTARDEGIASAQTSCLMVGEPGSTMTVELREMSERGVSKRSTLRTIAVDDLSEAGILLGEAIGQTRQSVTVLSDRDLSLVVAGAASVGFDPVEDSMTGRSGVGSIEAVYRAGEEWQICFESSFNQFNEPVASQTCEVSLAAGTPLEVRMDVPTGAGATVRSARLAVITAE